MSRRDRKVTQRFVDMILCVLGVLCEKLFLSRRDRRATQSFYYFSLCP